MSRFKGVRQHGEGSHVRPGASAAAGTHSENVPQLHTSGQLAAPGKRVVQIHKYKRESVQTSRRFRAGSCGLGRNQSRDLAIFPLDVCVFEAELAGRSMPDLTTVTTLQNATPRRWTDPARIFSMDFN